MEDRYLFRGISTLTDEFVIGTLNVNTVGEYFIDDQLIYQNTVGQCTGLKDKNGILIFEGDIVEFLTDEVGFDKWLARYGRPYIKFGDCVSEGWCTCGSECEVECTGCEDSELEGYGYHLFFEKTKDTPLFVSSDADRCLVVGNIYDNQELLK